MHASLRPGGLYEFPPACAAVADKMGMVIGLCFLVYRHTHGERFFASGDEASGEWVSSVRYSRQQDVAA